MRGTAKIHLKFLLSGTMTKRTTCDSNSMKWFVQKTRCGLAKISAQSRKSFLRLITAWLKRMMEGMSRVTVLAGEIPDFLIRKISFSSSFSTFERCVNRKIINCYMLWDIFGQWNAKVTPVEKQIWPDTACSQCKIFIATVLIVILSLLHLV